jgi:hypothetical protein
LASIVVTAVLLDGLSARKAPTSTSRGTELHSSNRCWRDDDFNQSGRDVIDQAGDKPLGRQCRNCAEPGDIAGDCGVGISDRFCPEIRFLNLKEMRQPGGVAGEAGDAAVGVLKQDEVKLAAAPRNLLDNLTDSSEETQLL